MSISHDQAPDTRRMRAEIRRISIFAYRSRSLTLTRATVVSRN